MIARSFCHGRHGDVVHQEQERIPQSEYHSLLDAEDGNEQAEPIASTKIRYWSDFSRVFFDPKSIQAVPDTPQVVEGDWDASCEAFLRYDNVRILLHLTSTSSTTSQNVELMDGSLRLLVEDCDNFQVKRTMSSGEGLNDRFIAQGVQMIQDTSVFGGFTNSFLSAFREEYPKATITTFACLSSISPLYANLADVSYRTQLIPHIHPTPAVNSRSR